MHVLILEAALSGHHAIYLEEIASAFLEQGNQVTVSLLRAERSHPFIGRLQARFGADFSTFLIDDASFDSAMQSRLGDIGREIKLRSVFAGVYRAVNSVRVVDRVFLPYVDYCLHALALLGSPFAQTSWSGICMRPSFHYQGMGIKAPRPKLTWLKQRLFERLLSQPNLRALLSIDELLVRCIKERNPGVQSRIVYLADPAALKGIHTQESAREALNLPMNAQILLCYGSMDRRKGQDVAIAAVALARDVHVLMVGRHAPDMAHVFSGPDAQQLLAESRLHVIDRYVDQAEEQMVFAAADAIWLGYRGHYTMSGVLVLAGSCGKPVVATDEGLIGWYTHRLELGETVSLCDLAGVSSAITRTTLRGYFSPESVTSGRSKFAQHTWEHFQATVATVLG